MCIFKVLLSTYKDSKFSISSMSDFSPLRYLFFLIPTIFLEEIDTMSPFQIIIHANIIALILHKI